MMEGSDYDSSFIDDEPMPSPPSSPGPQRQLVAVSQDEQRALARYRQEPWQSKHPMRTSPVPPKKSERSFSRTHLKPATTASKKLKAALSGVLDRSTCTLWEKRGALFDAVNNHPATSKPHKNHKRQRE